MRSLTRSVVAFTSAMALAGCGDPAEETRPDEEVSGVKAIYALPASLAELSQGTFFDQPWPSDLRLEGGHPRYTGHYNPRGYPLLDLYAEAATSELLGFSPAAAGYLRFTGEIDAATLPATPRDALDEAASVQLIDIDPASPEHRSRKLVSLRWQSAEGVYYRPHTLAFMPTIGFPLRPGTRYALVVTDALRDEEGLRVAQLPDVARLAGVKATDDVTRAAHDQLAPAMAEIEAAGIAPASLVHFTVFTTSEPTRELEIVRDAVPSLVPPPVADPAKWEKGEHDPAYEEYLGRYGPTPNFQAGDLPFSVYGDGGGFVFEGGAPVLQGTFDLRFSISVPDAAACPMPQAGYPIVLYAHGTGAAYQSYIGHRVAEKLALACIASMGVDQIFHGDRPGAPPGDDEGAESILFYNFQNPIAARTNGRQSAIDEVQRARLFTESKMVVPASISVTGEDVRFDASRMMYFGHSQGGLNGPLFLAVDPSVRGAVFSGSGAEIGIALLEKTKPSPSVASLVRTLLLGLSTEEASELDLFHPVLSLAQSIVDSTDPLHYARLIQREPRAGFAPKSVYLTEGISPEGIGDSYAPPHGIEAHALAIGLPLQLPMQRPIVESQWGGPPPVTITAGGLSGNLGGGKASGVLAQWHPPSDHDGHYVVFDIPGARAQSIGFLKSLAEDPVGLVPAP